MKPHFLLSVMLLLNLVSSAAEERPHIVLVMTDDQGWGQMGYYDHPHLKTPNLDAMAANGLRFDRFYAGASNCSPTRATVLTGRTNDRTGVQDHGFPLRLQEKTVAQGLRDVGYATGHFGKWHLNGLRGPGVPILSGDTHHPGAFGFETWFSVTNFFDWDPWMSRMGEIEAHKGDSSEIAVDAALAFIETKVAEEKPVFAVIWFGSPHSPMIASEADRAYFADLTKGEQHHLGELVAMDRSVGTLRAGLRKLGIAENTLVWFNSDNGGLNGYGSATVGGLRGFKNQMYEGGLRVPGMVEWPAVIEPRVTAYPAGTVDIFSTLADVAQLPASSMLQPQDGVSLLPLFDGEIGPRKTPLFFRHRERGVIIDKDDKLVIQNGKIELFDLKNDPGEARDLSDQQPEIANRLKKAYDVWEATVEASVAGNDYPEATVDPNQPERRFWRDDPAYQPYAEEWQAKLQPKK